jgi:3-oxoacyl-[acyl-carrier protein] reductase
MGRLLPDCIFHRADCEFICRATTIDSCMYQAFSSAPVRGRSQATARTREICYRPLSTPLGKESLARLTRTHLWTDLSTTEIPVNENRGLTGKIAIVFGGSRGICAAAARRLAREGADVTVTYVSTPERAADTVAAIEATGRTGLAIRADSADPAAIKAAVAQAVDHFGKLDIAVVNAGILLLGDVATVNVDDLDRMLNINVRGVFLAIQAAAARLTDGGRIITIGSNTAVRSGHPGSSVYSMTKAAVAVMVKGIAIDLASRGITVNNMARRQAITNIAGGSKAGDDHSDCRSRRKFLPGAIRQAHPKGKKISSCHG